MPIRRIIIEGFHDPDNGLAYQNNQRVAQVLTFDDRPNEPALLVGCTCPNCGDRGTNQWITAEQWAEFSKKVTDAFLKALTKED